MSYFNDARVTNALAQRENRELLDWLVELKLIKSPDQVPSHWVVCPTCAGHGRHVNPSIDCDGLTARDFADDPDFLDDYFSGVYDQTCATCNGRTTVAELDFESMSPEIQREVDEYYREAAEARYEQRMGY